MYDADEKKEPEEKENQVKTKQSKLEKMLQQFLLNGKGTNEASALKPTQFPTSAQLPDQKNDLLYKAAVAPNDPEMLLSGLKRSMKLSRQMTCHIVTLEQKIVTGLLETSRGECKRKVALRKQTYSWMLPPQMVTGRKLIKWV